MKSDKPIHEEFDEIMKDVDTSLMERWINENDNQPKYGKWISTKERFPEQYEAVLISDGKIVTTSYFQDRSFVGREIDIIPTHWMPLPKPAKE